MMKRLLSTLAVITLGVLGLSKLTPQVDPLEHKTAQVQQMIQAVEKSVPEERQVRLARSIAAVSERYQIDPKIIVAIIDTESDFRHHMVSSTGDLSLAQINPRVWSKELVRLGRLPLAKDELHKSEEYAIERMSEILSIIKERHAKKDPQWYSRYHSNTKKYRGLYQKKLGHKMNLIASRE